MQNGPAKLDRSRKIAYTSLMIALAIALRLLKGSMFGPLQFINFPGVFTIVSGIVFGPITGMVVGAGSYILSDILIGLPGPWTPINAILMGTVGLFTGLIWNRSDRTKISRIGIGVGTYVIMLVFDIFASFAFFAVSGSPWMVALTAGVAGLFVPTGGGLMYGIGPVTEAATAILVVTITHTLLKSKIIKTF